MVVKFPPEGYIPTKSEIEGIMVYMPMPDLDLEHAPKVDFECPNCGGRTAFDVEQAGLTCTTCGYFEPAKGKHVGRRASSNEFLTNDSLRKQEARREQYVREAKTDTPVVPIPAPHTAIETDETGIGKVLDESDIQGYDSTGHYEEFDWGEEREALDCSNCGASLLVEPRVITQFCPFCRSNRVVQHAFAHDKMHPEYLVPFKVNHERMETHILEWLSSSWLTPRDLAKRAQLKDIVGVYIPYWTFSAACSAKWKAQVGYTKTRVNSKGKVRTYTQWKWENGFVSQKIKDLLVSGTSKINRYLLKDVDRSYSMGSLVEYDASYLAGFHAQLYDIERDVAWAKGRQLMAQAVQSTCRSQCGTQKIRNFSMDMDMDEERWRNILLPLYSITYNYEDVTYQVLMNGQDGTISGQRPLDRRKLILTGVSSFVPSVIAGIIYLASPTEALGGVTAFLFAAAVFIVVSLIYFAVKTRRADADG